MTTSGKQGGMLQDFENFSEATARGTIVWDTFLDLAHKRRGTEWRAFNCHSVSEEYHIGTNH